MVLKLVDLRMSKNSYEKILDKVDAGCVALLTNEFARAMLKGVIRTQKTVQGQNPLIVFA